MAINKVVYGDDTLIDLTQDSVEASNLLEGERAHDRSGAPVTGTAKQGHIVQDAGGNNMNQRPTMQFVDAHLSDDSVGGKTKVETFKAVTQAEYSSETEDGAYIITDGDGAVIEPASEDYVEVTADGEKTWTTLLNELYALVDSDKVDYGSYLIADGHCFRLIAGGAAMYFDAMNNLSSGAYNLCIKLSPNSTYDVWNMKANGNEYSSKSSNKPTNGTKITLYYGQKKATVDLQTTANRCLMSNGNNVEDIIKKISLPVTAASGITLDINDLVQMNGIVFGTLEIEASSNWATGSWAEIGQILNYSNDKLIMAMAWDTSNGNYFGIVRIESNGSVKVYPKISTKYCQVRF